MRRSRLVSHSAPRQGSEFSVILKPLRVLATVLLIYTAVPGCWCGIYALARRSRRVDASMSHWFGRKLCLLRVEVWYIDAMISVARTLMEMGENPTKSALQGGGKVLRDAGVATELNVMAHEASVDHCCILLASLMG